MKNFFNFLKAENLKNILKDVISRFPISVLLILLTSSLFFYLTHGTFGEIIENNIIRTIFTSIVTFFLSISVYLTCENHNFSQIKKNIYQVIPILFGIIFFKVIGNDFQNFENMIFFILTLTGIISYLFFAPYLKNILLNKGKQSVYYTYFYKISVIFLISFILGGVLFTLGHIGIYAIFTLFDLEGILSNNIYSDWGIIALSLFTPIFALTQIPNKKSFRENYFNENAFFSFLIKYIAIPFIFIYFIILYTYSIKVLLNFGDWPKGEVSWMVICFSVFGYITYVFSYIFEEKNKFIKKFRKYFPFAVIPQIFMLFYAIYLRVNQYDLTINRYFVIIFGIWLLIISLYYAFSRKKYLGNVTFVLTIFTIIISIGPWSVYELPESRQLNRLEKNLIKAGILKDNKIIPLENYNNIDKKLSNEIYSGIDYMCDFDNCDSIKKLFPEIYKEIDKENKIEFEKRKKEDLKYNKEDKDYQENIQKREYESPSKWKIIEGISDKIKVKRSYINEENGEIKAEKYINFSLENNINSFPIQIENYSQLLRLSDDDISKNNYSFAKINFENQILEIIENEKIIDTVNIKPIFEKLLKNYKEKGSKKLSKKELTFEISTQKNNYKILFEHIEIINPEYKGDKKDKNYFYINGYVLIK